MNSEFPVRLPNPDNLFMPDADVPAFVHPTMQPRSAIPAQRVVTCPGLFRYGSVFHPEEGLSFIHMRDMLQIQALFAASQFLTARSREYGLEGISEPNPFIDTAGIACLYSELSLLGATLGVVIGEILLGARRQAAQAAYQNFTFDMAAYAPWFKFPEGSPGLWKLIKDSQDKLKEAQDLAQTHQDARMHFEQQQQQ